jgi:PmbA protein
MRNYTSALLEQVITAGLDEAEVYSLHTEQTRVSVFKGEVDSFTLASTGGLAVRARSGEHWGSAYTERFLDADVFLLAERLRQSIAAVEKASTTPLYAGGAAYPEVTTTEPSILFTPAEMISMAMEAEKSAYACDSRVATVQVSAQVTTRNRTIRNTLGLNAEDDANSASLRISVVARQGTETRQGSALRRSIQMMDVNPAELGQEAVTEALSAFGAESLPSGTYHVLLRNDAASMLLGAFASVFSGESALRKLSLLAGRIGQHVASPLLTLRDDPTLRLESGSAPFDAEGVPSRSKSLIEDGVLQTLLQNRFTAALLGTESTGNAARSGYRGDLTVAPTNLFFGPGTNSRADLIKELNNGFCVTDLAGMHAGANPISGDFSLLANGFLVQDGLVTRPVDQVTVAGNFFDLLKSVESAADDLYFDGSPTGNIGSPSLLAGSLIVAGN